MAATDYETAADVILQDWNGFGFKFITTEDHPKVLDQMHENFYVDEPLHKCAGMTPERQSDLDQRVTNVMNLNHGSFYAYPLDNPDKVASVLLIWFQEKGKSLPPSEERSPLTALIRRAVIALHSQYDIFEKHQVDVYPELFIISTDKAYRGKGLGTEMYRKAIAKFKAQDLPLVASTFTNPLSRKIGEKLGFEVKTKMDFDELKEPDGSPALGDGAKGQFAVETVLLLK